MKILILMAYYNRPNMVKLALQSIRDQGYTDWELAFFDDGSDISGKEIALSMLSEHTDKIIFFNSEMTKEDKINNGGSMLGFYWNKAMYSSDADIGIMLCDDDALYENYLENLNDFYTKNKDVLYSYGHMSIFNPEDHSDIGTIKTDTDDRSNYTTTINPHCALDASQVSWRIDAAKEHDIKFPYPKTSNLDAAIYEQFFYSFGYCQYNGTIAQYKGSHPDQMGARLHAEFDVTKE